MSGLPDTFIQAIKSGMADVVCKQLERGEATAAQMNAPAADAQHHAINLAYQQGQDMLRVLMEFGADINNPIPPRHKTVLDMALLDNKLEIAEYILTLPINVNHADDSGFTAIHNATFLGRAGLTAAVLEKGADINAKTAKGKTAFNIVAMPQGKTEAFVPLLAKMPRDARDEVELLAAIVATDIGAVSTVLARGVRGNLNEFTLELAPPLHIALMLDAREIATLLLDSGADANLPYGGKYVPLMYAKSAEVVRLLIAHGANVNAVDEEGSTPLMYLGPEFQYGNEPLVLAMCTELVMAGVDINGKTPDGKPVKLPAGIEVAIEASKRSPPTVNDVNNPALVHAFLAAIDAANVTEVEKMLTENKLLKLTENTMADAHERAYPLAPVAMAHAVVTDSERLVRLLVAHGGDVHAVSNVNVFGREQDRPMLQLAWEKERHGIVRLLVNSGANINVLCPNNSTNGQMCSLLHDAASWFNYGSPSAYAVARLQLLLDLGANPDTLDSEGRDCIQRTTSEDCKERLRAYRPNGGVFVLNAQLRTVEKEADALREIVVRQDEIIKQLLARVDALEGKASK